MVWKKARLGVLLKNNNPLVMKYLQGDCLFISGKF